MSEPGLGWKEAYLDGCQFAEAELIRRFMVDIHRMQVRCQRKSKSLLIRRPFHAKIHAGISNAEFRILATIPPNLRIGLFQPGKVYRAIVRFSNASAMVQPDSKKDLRGIAMRVFAEDEATQDFLLTNAAASHARDARQFMAFATAMGGRKLTALPKLLWGLGCRETYRMLTTVWRQASRPVTSLVSEQFWSRAPFALGPYALKFALVPTEAARDQALPRSDNYLRRELVERLKSGPVTFDFKAQLWINNATTPLEDATVEWREQDTRLVPLAQLYIPQQDLATPVAQAAARRINALAFNPWNMTPDFRPLGNLNRARRLVYKASAGLRSGREEYQSPGLVTQAVDLLLVAAFRFVNRFAPWHKLPPLIGMLNLIACRKVLREKNLHDTADPHARLNSDDLTFDPAVIRGRTPDGSFNDLNYPLMGCAGTRLGRNVPRKYTYPDPDKLLTPNPREISRHLLRREHFIPATSLNLLAAAWIQFQVHDWISHEGPDEADPVRLRLKADDDWGQAFMEIRRTPRAPQSPGEIQDGVPPVYCNRESHWWDGSQIYGSTKEIEARLRTKVGGQLRLTEDAHLLLINPETRLPFTGFTDNWWIGLYLFHTLFAQEHNAICDRLHAENPSWNDEELFNTARLINTALMAKIHTLEWTPAILAHPTLQIAMKVNWWGLATEKVHQLLGRISRSEVISGIPGSGVDHHGVPFALTEEFASVYRLHPLIPDEVQLFAVLSGKPIENGRVPIHELAFSKAQDVFEKKIASLPDVLYSFGISNPGAITLHNYPDFFRKLTIPKPDGSPDRTIDLAATDIYRDRERGVPRYNEFRQLVHRPPIKSFDELTGDNRKLAAQIRQVYGTDDRGRDRVDLLDLMVGMFAEPLPEGFGFSDTAFRIFILMASRRLKSDRFFARDFTPEVYTKTGLDWVDSNGLSSVLIRHYPELTPALRNLKNPFAPWRAVDEW
ncbi:MAG: catalase [Verrucomicrobia bacterium]|nr:catalase [Verrucomicrobiota bacterium]